MLSIYCKIYNGLLLNTIKTGLLYSKKKIAGKCKQDAVPLWLAAATTHTNARYELGLLLETGDLKQNVAQGTVVRVTYV